MDKKLSGRVALVTGGSRGIGAAIARALADNGADVGISYVASAEKADAVVAELQLNGVRAAAFKADQADPAEVEKLVKSVAEHFGHLDILVNNAGVFIGAPVNDGSADIESLNRQLAINYTAVAVAIRTASQIMGEGGRIISIGSVLGERAMFPGLADYAATKAAIVGYSKGAARDLASKQITVNVIQSGSIGTDMNPETSGFADAQRAMIAMGRFGVTKEIAVTVAFLASPEASYITGSVITVDGGLIA